jgi:hypothetical protein
MNLDREAWWSRQLLHERARADVAEARVAEVESQQIARLESALKDALDHWGLASAFNVGKIRELEALLLQRAQEIAELKTSILNQRGDDLCWVTDPEAVKALPQAEFLESCRRYHAQLVTERGEATGLRTIAQLEARIVELEGQLTEARNINGASRAAGDGNRGAEEETGRGGTDGNSRRARRRSSR